MSDILHPGVSAEGVIFAPEMQVEVIGQASKPGLLSALRSSAGKIVTSALIPLGLEANRILNLTPAPPGGETSIENWVTENGINLGAGAFGLALAAAFVAYSEISNRNAKRKSP